MVSALVRLFQSLDMEERESGTGQVSPNELREALSALPGELFRVGEMNDAGEVLLAIYDCIRGESSEVRHGEGTPVIIIGIQRELHTPVCPARDIVRAPISQ